MMKKGIKVSVLLTITALCILTLLSGCSSGGSGTYKAGTYTAGAKGYNEDALVVVKVEFDSESLLSVTVAEHNETMTIGDRAIDIIPDKIVEAQTYEVDAVTAATVTSDAIKAGVKDCIRQAKRK